MQSLFLDIRPCRRRCRQHHQNKGSPSQSRPNEPREGSVLTAAHVPPPARSASTDHAPGVVADPCEVPAQCSSILRMTRVKTPTSCCLNCAFLMGSVKVKGGYLDECPLSQSRRDEFREHGLPSSSHRHVMKNGTELNFQCHKGVPGVKWQPSTEWLRPRTDECFFFPYLEGRGLVATKELERREADRRQAKRDRKWAKIGVWVAIFALVVTLMWGMWSIWQHFNPPKATPQNAAMPATQPVPPSSP